MGLSTVASLEDATIFAPFCEIVQFSDSVAVVRGGHRYLVSGRAEWDPVGRLVRLCARPQGASYVELLRLFPADARDAARALVADLIDAHILLALESPTDIVLRENSPAFYHSCFGTDPRKLQTFVSSANISVIGDGTIAEAVLRSLRDDGAVVANAGEQSIRSAPPPQEVGRWDGVSIEIFISETSDFLELLRANHEAWQRGCAFIPVLISGWHCSIGPSVVPPRGPCARCLILRQNSALDDPAHIRLVDLAADAETMRGRFVTPSLAAIIGGLACHRVWSLSGGFPSSVRSSYHSLNLIDASVERIDLIELPYCSLCSQETAEEFSFDRLELGIVDDHYA